MAATTREQAMLVFRAALNRHLLEKGINIITDPPFCCANEVVDGVLKKLQREGSLKPTGHRDEIIKRTSTR